MWPAAHEVDEELLARQVLLPHDEAEAFATFLKAATELAVRHCITARHAILVLLPEHVTIYALFSELRLYNSPVWLDEFILALPFWVNAGRNLVVG
ncbi:hypothetical protein CSW62_12325 [Caulobacter sp. FWC2]|nr:hypothetical protein CSW62_12325 [Caulobacter sp. FWC2]